MSSVLLSNQEVQELNDLCSDPFLELGTTLRPKHLECFKSKMVTNSIKVIILFKEHVDADKWNRMHETRIRKGGHLVTITLAALVGLLSKNYTASVITASSVGIIKDEAQARIWFPKMYKEWVLTRHFNFIYVQFPSQYFYLRWTDIIQDETGKEVERRNHGQSQCMVGGSFGIPEKLVRDLMALYPLHTVNYK